MTNLPDGIRNILIKFNPPIRLMHNALPILEQDVFLLVRCRTNELPEIAIGLSFWLLCLRLFLHIRAVSQRWKSDVS